ncbi:cation-translocating P-type ATPase [Candidatus Villigracilis saccharophilus]|uniref:cation-translocating P-type ATPase n=1 Tax=Candidatus Villigracilis saccharophilus TaxID=3140684 RepID=UPI00313665A4|nr:cation-translocating P-type ATPase [Anaerolineales bacterium]
MNWHLQSIDSSLEALQSKLKTGLSQPEAESRLTKYGRNELIEKSGRTPFKIFWEQITATMVLILIAAAVVAGLLGDTKNTIAITAIVLLYAILGFVQEYRAEQAISALKKLSVPNVRVLRDGALREISARELVPGDIIQLEAGNVLPADVRLLEAVNLRIQEAALTGESEPVEKQTASLSGEGLPLGDRLNMGYMGTIVTQGRGLALVIATGMQTELGKIADLIQQSDSGQTPLQKRLDTLGKNLAIVGVVIAVFIAVLGLLRGDELRHMLLTAVSVAVAIVPEGLPAVVTITLALGAQRMLKQNALIRKLPAVETLGSVTVICSDKTGTLTENRMTVVVLDVAGHELDLTEEMDKHGSVRKVAIEENQNAASLSLLAIGGTLCNDAQLINTGDGGFHTLGDPTEGALVAAAAKMGFWKSTLDSSFPRAAELPFDSERKRMTTVHHLEQYDPTILAGLEIGDHRYIAFTKGSVDGLLGLSNQVWVNGQLQRMDANFKVRIEAANERLAKKGMRVLGVAFRMLNQIPEVIQTDLEQNLTFIGLFGMIDPPREEVRDAVAITKSAGIRTVMITGDHPLTASEIARQLGIISQAAESKVLSGAEIENLSFDELKNVVDEVQVFARVSPEHKLKIVQALQERGHIVSMTGDGVNDAPALKRADIGVAMGITGTDVSKEAADMVLLDDNFSTIVSAVKEGRTIYDNIRKFVRFSVAGNIGKVLVMLLAPFLGKPIPLLPLQLLWLNLLTDGLLGLGMGVENAESDTMKRPPYSPKEGVFSRGAGVQVIWVGALIGALALGLGSWYYFRGLEQWQTMVFTFLAFAQVFQAWASRSATDSFFKLRIMSNPLLAGMSALVVGLQLTVLYVPFLADFFSVKALSLCDLSIAIAGGIVVFVVMEVEKWLKRK